METENIQNERQCEIVPKTYVALKMYKNYLIVFLHVLTIISFRLGINYLIYTYASVE